MATPSSKVQRSSLGHRLVSNTLFNFGGQAFSAVIALVCIPYVVHRLGLQLYGVIAVVAAVGLGGMLNLGLGRTLAKYVSEYGIEDGAERVRNLFQTSLAVTLTCGIAGFALIVGFRKSIAAAFFHSRSVSASDVTFALILTGLALFIALASDCLSGLLTGLQRFDVLNGIYLAQTTIRNIGAVVVLALGLFFRAVLTVYLLAGVVGICGYAYYGRRLFPRFSLIPRFRQADFKQIFGFSLPVMLTAFGSLAITRLDRVLVAYFLPISSVAFYAIPYYLAERTMLPVGNIASVVFPSASELAASAQRDRLRELYMRGNRMVALVGLPVTIVLTVIPSRVLYFWVGPQFSERGSVPLVILALGWMVVVLGVTPFVVIQGIGRPWLPVSLTLSSAVLTLGLVYELTPRYGITGASIAFTLAECIVIPPLIWIVGRVVGASWRRLLTESYVPPFACALASAGALWLMRPLASSLGGLIAACGTALGLYAVAAWVVAIKSDERATIIRQARLVLGIANRRPCA